MPVRAGPTSPAPPVLGKSGFASWHLLHSSFAKSARPLAASPRGRVNFQPRGTPPWRCSSSMEIGAGGVRSCGAPWPACCARAMPNPSASAGTRPEPIASARAYGPSTPGTSVKLELDGQVDPHRDGARALPCRLEFPPAHGVGRRAVEIGMPRGLPDDDVADASVGLDEHAQERDAFDAEPACAPRIGRDDLVAAARKG